MSRQMKGQKSRRMDRSYFTPLPATARSSTSATAVDWSLKVKDTEYDVSLTKKILHHSQHAKNQLN